MGAYNFIAGELTPVPLECSCDQLCTCGVGWDKVGNFVPHAFSLHVFLCSHKPSDFGWTYRVRVLLNPDSVDDIYCESLSDLLRLLGNLTPVALMGADHRKERIQQLGGVNLQGAIPGGGA